MDRRIVAVWVSLIMLLSLIIIVVDLAPPVRGTVVYVGGAGPGNFPNIQAGINAANPGDTVFVYSGTYVENVGISKRISLVGEDKFSTVIDGNSITDTVTIAADQVNVSGFTITGGNPFGVFLQANSENNTIENNIISSNDNSGVEMYWYSHYNTVANNTITGNSMAGVVLHSKCDNNAVADNYIDDNSLWGIIITNPFDDYPNSNNRISGNTINNSEIGIYLYNINDRNRLENNTVNNTDYGISLYLSNNNNTINGNRITNSSICGMYLLDLNENNRIYHNNFVNNAFQAFDNGTNYWNLTYPGGGNFWDDYSGGDNCSGPLEDIPGNDAFGDVSYSIAGGTSEDFYPLWPNWNALEFYKPFPGETDVCEYAIGNVKVAVIFVESNGSIDPESEDWTAPRQSTVLSEIQDALTWWESLEANSSLNLSIEVIGSKNTSYEPISRPSSDDELWIEEIMADMGFSQGIFLQRVMSFNHWLRQQYDTDWAYTIFVVDSLNDADGAFADPPTCAYSYSTASIIVMTYDNNGYGIAKMNNVTAHETGHMFYATDEYKNPGETGGYLNASEVDNSGCLMDDNTLVLSSGTELQIGWRDTDSDGIMDILDTEPNTYLVPYEPDPTFNNTPSFTGYAIVVPYPNNNPYGFGRDVTLNTISNVQFRIDNGSWANATAADGDFDEAIETFQFTTTQLSPGVHLIETRAVNSVNNSDFTYANDTITILGDYAPPAIEETTVDIPVSGNNYNITANVSDNMNVDTVWLEYTIISSEGFNETHNVSMNHYIVDSYWSEISIWPNATWFNYSIKANDTSNNWNGTPTINLRFLIHNVDTGEGFIEIQTAIDDSDTLDGHTIFVDSGIFYENVVVDKSIHLTGEDKENTLIDGGGGGNVVYLTADLVSIADFTITNGYRGVYVASSNNTIYENKIISNSEDGIYLTSSYNNTIYNNNVNDHPNVGIYLKSTTGGNTFTSNTLYLNNYGFYLESSDSNILQNNTIYNNDFNGIEIIFSQLNSIINNTIHDHAYYGIYFHNAYDFVITGNTIYNSTIHGIYFHDSSNITLIQNNVHDNSEHGIYVRFSTFTDIIQCNVSSNNMYGIYLFSSTDSNLEGNNCSNNNFAGIALGDWSDDNTIVNNSALNNGNQGIVLYLSSYNNVTGNILSLNEHGLWIGMSEYNNVTNNHISDNNDQGLTLYDDCSNITIDNNLVSNNFDGISLYSSDYITISNNNITLNNQYGFYVRTSINNLIYHNNIINNTDQAFDDSDMGNQWDNGYPSGGNFWSEYSGDDVYSGPNQDIPGNDGIGDTNYSIDSDSRDNYPLMHSIGEHIFLYEGWNLISLPFIQSDMNLGTVLSSISGSYDAVQWYDPTDSIDPWKHNCTTKPEHLNDLGSLDHKVGFWVHITDQGGIVFEYTGSPPVVNQTITLYEGWNMVGFPSLTNKTRDIGLNNLTFGTEVDAIFTFDAVTQSWEEVGPSDYFELGRGYWIHATQECEWEVPL